LLYCHLMYNRNEMCAKAYLIYNTRCTGLM
jgi:hypothetical protein